MNRRLDFHLRILETFITVLTCMYLYQSTVTNFGKLETLSEMPWTLDLSFFIGGIVSAMVQVCSDI
jgi:hypothetical protein